jgi:transposase
MLSDWSFAPAPVHAVIGWYQAMHAKSANSQEIRALLTARRLLLDKLRDVELSLRGVLCGFGLKLGKVTQRAFETRVPEHLRHLLSCYQKYYNEVRPHLALKKDAPISRDVQRAGRALSSPILGGLHHRYARV